MAPGRVLSHPNSPAAAVAVVRLSRVQILTSSLDFWVELSLLCPEPPTRPPTWPRAMAQRALSGTRPSLLTDKAWHNSSADSSLKLFPAVKGRGGGRFQGCPD